MPTARTTAGLGVAAAAIVLPLLLPGTYHRHMLVLAGLFVLMALGFDLVLGYLGELSLGHAAFFGIGAYTTALLTRNFGIPFPLDLLLAALCTGVFGFLIGAPSLRLKGPYFASHLRLPEPAAHRATGPRSPAGDGLPTSASLPRSFRIHRARYYYGPDLIGLAILVTRRLLDSTSGTRSLPSSERGAGLCEGIPRSATSDASWSG